MAWKIPYLRTIFCSPQYSIENRKVIYIRAHLSLIVMECRYFANNYYFPLGVKFRRSWKWLSSSPNWYLIKMLDHFSWYQFILLDYYLNDISLDRRVKATKLERMFGTLHSDSHLYLFIYFFFWILNIKASQMIGHVQNIHLLNIFIGPSSPLLYYITKCESKWLSLFDNTPSASIWQIGCEFGAYFISLALFVRASRQFPLLFNGCCFSFFFHPISTIQRWTFHFHAPKFFVYVFILCRLHSFRLSLAPKNDGLVVCACNGAPAIPTMICDFNYTQILCTVKVLLL